MSKNLGDRAFGPQIKAVLSSKLELLLEAQRNSRYMFTVLYIPGYLSLKKWLIDRDVNKNRYLATINEGNEHTERLAQLDDEVRRVNVLDCAALINAIPQDKLKEKYGWCAARAMPEGKDILHSSKVKIFERLFQPFFKHTYSQKVTPRSLGLFEGIRNNLNVADRLMHMYYFMWTAYPRTFWNIINTREDLLNIGNSFRFTRDSETCHPMMKFVPVATIKSWPLLQELEVVTNPQFIAEVKNQERMEVGQLNKIEKLLECATRFTGMSPDEALGSFRVKESVTTWDLKDLPPKLHSKLEWIIK